MNSFYYFKTSDNVIFANYQEVDSWNDIELYSMKGRIYCGKNCFIIYFNMFIDFIFYGIILQKA